MPMAADDIAGLIREAIPDAVVEITGADAEVPHTFVYHAGTKLDDAGKLVTSGGRVLTVVGIADDLQKARDLAYARVETIKFKNEHHRNDIGDKSLKGAK